MNLIYKVLLLPFFAAVACSQISCTKFSYDDSFKAGDPPPIGNYSRSDEVAADNLIAHFSFDDNVTDSKNNISGGEAHNISFVSGQKGKAYKGSENGYISFANSGTLPSLTSFTITMWVNTQKHQGGAQGLFTLPKTGSFWGNLFMLVEQNTGITDLMQLKAHVQRSSDDFWLDLGNGDNRAPGLYGGWKQLVMSYNEETSRLELYVNGTRLNLPGTLGNVKVGNPAQPMGKLHFADAGQKFIIGGYQNQLGAPFNTPESWMLTYTGAMDEFRIYNRALTAQELTALYKLEKQGR